MSDRGARLRRLNERPVARDGRYVLYWMQAYRRLQRNHALDYALRCAREIERPLLIFEGLRLDYPWASPRLQRFVLEGMLDNAADAADAGFCYRAFVEREPGGGRGLLRRLAEPAALVVTDDYPCFVVPDQSAALARRAEVAVFAVDGNGVVPLAALGDPASAAAHLRHRLHAAFAQGWAHRPTKRPTAQGLPTLRPAPAFEAWVSDVSPQADVDSMLASLPLAAGPAAVRGKTGGRRAAQAQLRRFVGGGLPRYAEERSHPASPEHGSASGLSPWLHFGHLSIDEVVEAVLGTLGDWSPGELRFERKGRREGFYCDNENVNAFLDEALTWRDLGFHWHRHRRADAESLEGALPPWALETLRRHATDRRAHTYTPEQWEAGETHDPLWNAAQRELVTTGTIHNYLRMLWGKKVIEWSRTPEEAYATLVHLNNRYALDGRDPNSWTGILWCFGLFDRPWAPERPVLGRVRYMSSDNTARKFKLGAYLEYVDSLPTIEEARG